MIKIAIASGKGGTGKTTISTNLAYYLSEKSNGKIILADLDVEEPNSGLFIKGTLQNELIQYKEVPNWQEENCSLCGKCQELCNFNAIIRIGSIISVFPEMCHSCYACSELCPNNALPMTQYRIGVTTHFHTTNLDFVEGKMDIGQEMAVPLISKTKKYIESISSDNAITIMDSPPGTSCPVIETTKDADLVFLVTEPTPFGLHDLQLAVETMRKMGKEFYVIVNRHGIGSDDVLQYCKKEKIEVIAKIPNSKNIAMEYSSGNLVFNNELVLPELKKIEEIIMRRYND